MCTINIGKKPDKYIIGITGGVGSGKSTVLDILQREHQAFVIQADLVARELMEPGKASYKAVVQAFGEEILLSDGTINRRKLGSIVFADEEKRLLLNSLTHPLVEQETRRRMDEAHGLIVWEAALPKEAGFDRLCDTVWYIHVPEEIRIKRLMESRGYTREQCLRMMANQLSEEEFVRLADVVIENGGLPCDTAKQIAAQLKTQYGAGI